MRAREFIVEYKLSVSKDSDGVAVKATAGGKNLGHAEFFFDEEGRLDPQTVWVDERYHGQGIARDMYDHLKDLGYTIVRSWDQTDAGRGFWNKHRGEDARVWESFDQPYPLFWEKSEYDAYDAYTKLDDGSNLSISFELESAGPTGEDEAWHVSFWRNYSLELTGEGDAQRVFATVLTAIQKFIKKENPERVTFNASKQVGAGQNSQSRARLYDRMVQRYASAWGYQVHRKDAGEVVTYDLVRKDTVNEISRDRLERYLDRAGRQVDTRQERMARARQRLSRSYEIYHADEPTKIVDRFEADTPADAQRYYQDYIANYDSDVDYDLRLRRGTGIMESENNSTPEVYLDMDGVLANFMAGYNRVAGTNYGPGQRLPHPSEDPTLKKITGTDFFSTLPKFASADALVRMVVDQYGHYNICSSPLRGDHENSAANKRAWLTANLQPQPQEIVITSRKEKYAVQPNGTPNILVDDKPENIQRWNAAGGTGILYNAAVDDLDTVTSGLQLNENFADGKVKGKSRPGRVKRAGASCSGSVTDLRAKAKKYGGEKGKMYHWCANMKSGRQKNK